MTPILQTPRLMLRLLTPEDWDAYRAFALDPEVQRWQLQPAVREADLQTLFRHYLTLCSLGGLSGAYAVCSRTSGALVGVCVSWGSNGSRPGEAQFGFVFGRAYWNRGYATEASEALLAHLFATVGVSRVWAGCYTGNKASARVLAKLGMHCVSQGHLTRWVERFRDGADRVKLWHTLTAEEWRAKAGEPPPL